MTRNTKTNHTIPNTLWCVTAECLEPEGVNAETYTTPEPHWFNADIPEPTIKAWLKTLNVKVRGVSLYISRRNPNCNLPTNWGLPPTPENDYSPMIRHYSVNSRGALRDDTPAKRLPSPVFGRQRLARTKTIVDVPEFTEADLIFLRGLGVIG